MSKVQLFDVSKKYNIYERPTDRLLELITRNRKSFHREYWALKNINLSFEPGITTGILGRNGSGKSTLLQIIAGVLQPTTGAVQVNGRVSAILELGAGFQSEYTGRENVMMGGMILGISEAEMRKRIEGIVDFAEIGDFLDLPIKLYSSGMVVRLAFGLCISVDPDILLIDEALAVGDSKFREKCYRRIREMQKSGTTIIFVSHDAGAVSDLCDKAVLLSNGIMINQGAVDEVICDYETLMQQEASGAFTIPQAVSV